MLLLVSVPLVALCVSSWVLLSLFSEQNRQATGFGDLLDIAVKSSALLHETQKEHGASAGFISSNGIAFTEVLARQRALTDKRISEFQDSVSRLNTLVYGVDFENNIAELTSIVSGLPLIRSQVTSLTLSLADEVSYYTSISSRILNVSKVLARLAPNGSLANSASAFATFLQTKERASTERAVLSSVFASNNFSNTYFDQFRQLINTQEIYLAVFKDMLSTDDLAFYHTQLDAPSVKAIESMRSIALAHADTGSYGIDPEDWFSSITRKINQLKSVEDYLSQELYRHASQVKQAAASSFNKIAIILLAAVSLSIFLLVVITRSLDITNSNAMRLANSIANGDLTGVDQSNNTNESGQLLHTLNRMQHELNRVISESLSVSKSVDAGTLQFTQSSNALQQRADEQVRNLEQTASSTKEISSTISRNAKLATHAGKLAAEACDVAEHGGKVADSAIKAMTEINQASREIANITNIIDEIAFQTNLLALNAAVEAARAGEQGRGFAVVASEVQSLAGRSAMAAKEIKNLIEDSLVKVEAGAQYVDQSGNALDKIVDSVKKVNEIIANIATVSQEQSIGVENINQSMIQLNTITQENSKIAEVASNAGDSMLKDAKSLSESLNFFQLRHTS